MREGERAKKTEDERKERQKTGWRGEWESEKVRQKKKMRNGKSNKKKKSPNQVKHDIKHSNPLLPLPPPPPLSPILTARSWLCRFWEPERRKATARGRQFPSLSMRSSERRSEYAASTSRNRCMSIQRESARESATVKRDNTERE